jgi:PHS family inorganic phosphate transporter-like MFS transporter
MSDNNQLDSVEALDNAEFSKFHWKMVLTAGVGFFTDAYDLFVIGVVMTVLQPLWHLTTTEKSLLTGGTLAAAALGASTFGFLSDKFGRKRMYGTEIAIQFVGAILSAVSMNFTMLLISRIIIGFGIGGDYPSSAVVASESASKKNRGFMVLLVFCMQAVGLTIGPLFATFLLALHIPHDIVWRVLLGVAAIPAACVFVMRRRIQESPRFKLLNEAPVEVGRVVSHLAGYKDSVHKARRYAKQSLWNPKWLLCLLGTGGAWFLMDVSLYGNGIFSTSIYGSILPGADLIHKTLLTTITFLVFAVPGYYFAAKYVDRIGRKKLQILGFVVMAACFATIAFVPAVRGILILFVLLYGLSFFFTNFGPNSTTFLIPSEVYPTSIRAKAHGLSAAIGKLGAATAAFILPFLLASKGVGYTMGLMSVCSLLGILVTFLIPEMKGRSLEDVEEIIEG